VLSWNFRVFRLENIHGKVGRDFDLDVLQNVVISPCVLDCKGSYASMVIDAVL
jgi:hypothetical protein